MGKALGFTPVGQCCICGKWHLRRQRGLERKTHRAYCSKQCMATGRGYDTRHICPQCGDEFIAYRKSSSIDRKYCSWACANKANNKSSLSIRERIRYEYELMHLLSTKGWCCQRTDRGRGPFDVVAINSKVVRLIQVKSTMSRTAESNISDYAKAVRLLRQFPDAKGVQKWLYLFEIGVGWRSVDIASLPDGKIELRSTLKDWVAA